MSISIIKKTLKHSYLRYIVYNNFYFCKDKLSYGYDFYEIKNDIFLVGYIIKYNIPTKYTEYIDIYICNNFRNSGIGSKALNYYIDKISTKDIIAIITTNENKIRFLNRNNFKFNDVYIYKNMYIFEKEGNTNG